MLTRIMDIIHPQQLEEYKNEGSDGTAILGQELPMIVTVFR